MIRVLKIGKNLIIQLNDISKDNTKTHLDWISRYFSSMIYTWDGILWENPNCVWSINSHFRIWKSYENILYQKSYWKGSKSEFLWGHKLRKTVDFYVLLHIFAVGPSVARVIKHRFNASRPRPFLGQLDSAMKFSGAVVWAKLVIYENGFCHCKSVMKR